MFGEKKDKPKDNNKVNERLVKTILKKNPGRRTFGFGCSPDIQTRLKTLAGKLQVPIYALGEHALQLSAGLIAKMAENTVESAILRKHLIEVHVQARTTEKIRAYDQDMADRLDAERIRRLEIDKAVNRIVINFIRTGLEPQELPWLIGYGLRCRVAVKQGKPIPTDWPKEGR
jgi:hypothetical protein